MDAKILVNGKEVRLKDYPKRVLYNLLVGYVKSQNLEEEPREFECMSSSKKRIVESLSFEVQEEHEGLRLDQFLAKVYPDKTI